MKTGQYGKCFHTAVRECHEVLESVQRKRSLQEWLELGFKGRKERGSWGRGRRSRTCRKVEVRKSFLSRSAHNPLKQKPANKCSGKEITRSWRRLDGSCEMNLNFILNAVKKPWEILSGKCTMPFAFQNECLDSDTEGRWKVWVDYRESQSEDHCNGAWQKRWESEA